ncbi:phage baseplate protein [Fluviispira vulneris]|uniref:phage baseplate protein n=1 Tax=Fluviispira vulneris TaxID=2763012 RepID=UPI00164459B2|nr:hypothetical protein [Fluviispira vulneris]
MSFMSFFKTGEPCLQFQNIKIDVSMSETHSYEANATKNPVEEGSSITDNIVLNPPKINIKGICSPLKLEILGGLKLTTSEGFVKNKWRELVDLFKAKEPMYLYTGLANYSDMVMTSLTANRDISNANHLEFEATFEKKITVPVEYTMVLTSGLPKVPAAGALNAATKSAGGAKNPISKDRSILDHIF